MPRWAVIQHVAFEGPGLIASEARARGLALDIRRMDRGDPLPAVDELDGLVVMGGPMGVHDTAEHGWLALERQLVADAVKRGLSVLGVCLGAQQLAAALGAQVRRGPAPEVGLGEVELTEGGRTDPVLGPVGTRLAVLHWHHDTFDPPPGAVPLARSARYENQAFRVGERAYGLQFHVELDGGLARELEPHLPPGVVLPEAGRARVERAGRPVIGRLLELAAAS